MRIRIFVVFLILLTLAPACASYKPRPLADVPLLERAETEEQGGLRVTAAVPTRKETRQIFGTDLYEKKIQPVWIEVENFTDGPFWIMLTATDPNYYSAREAAYISHSFWCAGKNRKMDRTFDSHALNQALLPHCATSGFVFTNLKKGLKDVRVRLVGEGRIEDFEFHISVPGLRVDFEKVDFEAVFENVKIIDIDSEDQLRDVIAEMPVVTTKENGKGSGDPLNLVVIGDLKAPFSRAEWDVTERITFQSSWKMVKGFFGKEYKNAPMSSLYVFGRHQDLGLQKARDTIHERNHLRLWLTPYTYNGKYVWLGHHHPRHRRLFHHAGLEPHDARH